MKRALILVLTNLASMCYAQQTSQNLAQPGSSRSQNYNLNQAIDHSNGESTSNAEISTPTVDATKSDDKEKTVAIHSFTGSLSLVSDYRSRGISQTIRQPALQGIFDYKHISGFYLGFFGSNVDGTGRLYNNTSLELDFYAGYKAKLLPALFADVEYQVGAIYYYYPGGKVLNRQSTRYNTVEFYVELIYKWLNIKYLQTITNYFGINANNTPFNVDRGVSVRPNKSSRGSIYVEANASFDLVDKHQFCCFEASRLSLTLHIGHQTVRRYGQLSYTDWRATLTQNFAWFNVLVSYVGTDANHDYYDVLDNAYYPKKHALGAQGVVVGLVKTF